MSLPEQPRRARHLMVPGEPPRRPTGGMSITTVQRWVLSSLALITIEHLAGGIIVAAIFLEGDRPGAQIGLLVIAGAFSAIGIAAALAIHGKALLSPWLAAAVIPPAIGAWLCFGL